MPRRVGGDGSEIRGGGVDSGRRIRGSLDSAGREVAAVSSTGRRRFRGGEGVRGGGDFSDGVRPHAEGLVGRASGAVLGDALARVGEVSLHRFLRHGVSALYSTG